MEIVTYARVDNIGNCHLCTRYCHFEKTTVDRGEVEADSGFRGASPGPHQVNICAYICILYIESNAHISCEADIFLFITRRQAISQVAKL